MLSRPKAVSKRARGIDKQQELCYNGDVRSRAAPRYRLLFGPGELPIAGSVPQEPEVAMPTVVGKAEQPMKQESRIVPNLTQPLRSPRRSLPGDNIR